MRGRVTRPNTEKCVATVAVNLTPHFVLPFCRLAAHKKQAKGADAAKSSASPNPTSGPSNRTIGLRTSVNSLMLTRRSTYCGASDITPAVLEGVAALAGHDVAFYAGAKAVAEEQLASPGVPLPRFEYEATFKGTGRAGSATEACRGTLPAVSIADEADVPMAFRAPVGAGSGASFSSPLVWYAISGGAFFIVLALFALVAAACALWFGRGVEGPEETPLAKGDEEGGDDS